ncbi:MAG: CBS domain-containing protein [Candidatus Aminicenantes bacterium]|nr:CBS domain-containing protein [Candidatus Aminicenantes bacterium]MCJ7488177.1 CBS domain-containing protein [Candidatus Aminicenantes bacterium]
MKTAGDILTANNQEVWTISPTATVYDALKLMSDKNIGALPVKDKGKNVVGIVSERDYARKVILLGKTSRETSVEIIMTPASEMITIQPGASLEDCMGLMTIHHIRHLPVFAGERLIGIISSRDVVEAVIAEKNGCIDNLNEFSETLFMQNFDDHLAGGKG